MKKFLMLIVALLSLVFFAETSLAQEESAIQKETPTQNEELLPRAGITPSSPFFFLEQISENVGTFFTFGKVAKARRLVKLAEERLSEAKVLADRGDENAPQATELYKKQFTEAQDRAIKSKNSEALAKVAESTSKHFAVLEQVVEHVPKEARESIKQTIENSQQGQISALRALSEVNPERAVEAGAIAARVLASQIKTYAIQKRVENFSSGIEHFGRVFDSFAPVAQNRVEAAAQFSERIADVVGELGEAKIEAQNAGINDGNTIDEVKNVVINTQLSSLQNVVRENPERAVQIYSRVAERSLQNAKKSTEEEQGSAFTRERLNDFNKYSEFGQQISQMAKGIRTGETSIQELVKQATSNHANVLQNIRQELPPQAQQEFQLAIDNSQRVLDQRPTVPLSNQEWARPASPSDQQQKSTPLPFQRFEESFEKRQNMQQQREFQQPQKKQEVNQQNQQIQNQQPQNQPERLEQQMKPETEQQNIRDQQNPQQFERQPIQQQMQQPQQPQKQFEQQQSSLQQPMNREIQPLPTNSFQQPPSAGTFSPPPSESSGSYQSPPTTSGSYTQPSGGSYSPPPTESYSPPPSGGGQPPPPPPQ